MRPAGPTGTAEGPEGSPPVAPARPRPARPAMPPPTPEREATIARWLAAGGVMAQEARRHLARSAATAPAPAAARPLGGVLDRLTPSRPPGRPAAGAAAGPPSGRGDIWRDLGPGCAPDVARRALAALCRAFAPTDSQDFQPAYAQVIERVRLGEVPGVLVEAAYREAHRPGIHNRGAAFAAALRRAGML